jgi:hypothetical protein
MEPADMTWVNFQVEEEKTLCSQSDLNRFYGNEDTHP